MDVVDPPSIPVKTKIPSPKRKKARNGIGAQNPPPPPAEHASYYATVITAPYFPVEVTPRA